MKPSCPKAGIYSWDALQGCRTAFVISLKNGRLLLLASPPPSSLMLKVLVENLVFTASCGC